MDRILHHQRAERLALRPSVDVKYERMALRVLPARPTAAEPAGGERRPLADPTVHSRSPNGPAEAGPDIMARSRPEITH